MGGPKMIDWKLLIQAGINPKNGLPIKFGDDEELKNEIRKTLRILDEQDAVNRYKWTNIPCNLTSQEIERMLYYKGELCLFYYKDLDEFYFMPYALDGGLDFYGRFNRIHPVPMNSGADGKEEEYKAQEKILSEIKLNVVYGVKFDEDLEEEDFYKSAVILRDYTNQLSQHSIPRYMLNDALLGVMSECIPYMRTNLLLSTGIEGIRVNDADQADAVEAANRSIRKAAMDGEGYVPIVGSIEYQELSHGNVGKSEEYMLAMQSLDNYRLSLYGIDNGGLFQKKAHELQSEADINGGPVGLVMQDGLSIRQNFCNIVNSIWGIGIWCEPAENIAGADLNGDGVMYDRNDDASSSGVENDGGAEDDDSRI